MPSTLTFNGGTYSVPVTGDSSGWGPGLSVYLAALATGAAGVSSTNTFTVQQTFAAAVSLASQVSAPAQTANAQLYADANGNVFAMPGSTGGAGQSIQLTPAAKYANVGNGSTTLKASDAGKHFINQAATGAVTFVLPTATFTLEYEFSCTQPYSFVVTGATNSIVGPNGVVGTSVTINGTVPASVYTTFKLSCFDGTHWLISSSFGTILVA